MVLGSKWECQKDENETIMQLQTSLWDTTKQIYTTTTTTSDAHLTLTETTTYVYKLTVQGKTAKTVFLQAQGEQNSRPL